MALGTVVGEHQGGTPEGGSGLSAWPRSPRENASSWGVDSASRPEARVAWSRLQVRGLHIAELLTGCVQQAPLVFLSRAASTGHC